MDKKQSLKIPIVEDQKGVLPELIETEVKGDRSADDEVPQSKPDSRKSKAAKEKKREIYTGF
jgi:hypothetical protein